ncbi:MAG: hypothetical protein WA741_19000 [Candidatus Sulfotelmatobacter sp.]
MSSVVHILGWTFLVLGWVLAFLGSVWIIVLAWQRSILWGLICFLLPIVQLVYVAGHWKESKEAFFLHVAGLVLTILAAIARVPGSQVYSPTPRALLAIASASAKTLYSQDGDTSQAWDGIAPKRTGFEKRSPDR